MRSAGCVYNDIVDRKFDRLVERTSNRPLACGALSVSQAVALLIILLLSAAVVLLQLPTLTIMLGIASLALVFVYPWMKRITYWPQIFLGLTFNWGALMGWSAVNGSLNANVFWLYIAGIFWTLVYDTIYAHQDKDDDSIIGVKSTALKLGKRSKPFLSACAVCMVLSLNLIQGADFSYYVAIVLVGSHLSWQILTVKLDDQASCMAKFKSNQWIGWLMLLGMTIKAGFFA